MKSKFVADMHRAKKIRGLFHSISADLPKDTGIFFAPGLWLAKGINGKKQNGYEDKDSIHKAENGFQFRY